MKQDILGGRFESVAITQEPDYTGEVRCTVVRLRAENSTGRAVLHVHGFSDYFFHREMAEEFARHGYDFYAVDLRRYGRSILRKEDMFRVKDLREYFADIDAALNLIKADGATLIVLMGHSTGGLTTSLYMGASPDPAVRGLILNSPFLTWNMPRAIIAAGIPVVRLLSHIAPGLKMKGDTTNRYAASLARHLGGEWDYNTEWKPDVLPPVTAEWVRAIDKAQKELKRGVIKVPVLFMHSDKSTGGSDGMDRFRISDGVLNVHTMAKVGRALGPDVTEVTITDGLHDLVLSRKDVREEVYRTIFTWLRVTFG